MRKTLLDIAFFQEPVGDTPEHVLAKHQGTWEHYAHLTQNYRIVVIKFCRFESKLIHSGIEFYFMPLPSYFRLGLALKLIVQTFRPDFILNHSFQFPLASGMLNAQLPESTQLLLQHHGDLITTKSLKLVLQRWAYKRVSTFLFTGKELAEQFQTQKIISEKARVVECMEGSSSFERSHQLRGASTNNRILWVGRLISGKDPFTFIKALSLLKQKQVLLEVRMVFQTSELEKELRALIDKEQLQDTIALVGGVQKNAMSEQYEWANYFISTSHREGSGWALCEAMSMGVFPIVTDIPSHKFMTGNGQFGKLFKVGDASRLTEQIELCLTEDGERLSQNASEGFETRLSFKAIADTLATTLTNLQI